MVSYKELGLVNTKEMFAKAIKGGYAIPAFNFNNMEQLQAIIKAAVETKSPVILQVSKGARNYANQTLLRYMAEGAVQYAKELGCEHPQIVLHLDHGDSFELCKSCVDMGFSSVMIDGSHLPYEENVALTKKVVDYAHQYDVTVEGELGVLAGVEDEVSAEHHTYTDPEEVVDFATRTGCDSLAISIGTSHGAYKFKPEQCHVDPATGRLVPPPLAFDVLDAVMEKLPGFPIVLHGSSSVPQEEVETINKYGGKLEAAIGIPEEELRKAAKSAVCKINIDSDSRLAMTAAIRKVFAEKPAEFDPRKYLGPARDNMEKLYKHKILNVQLIFFKLRTARIVLHQFYITIFPLDLHNGMIKHNTQITENQLHSQTVFFPCQGMNQMHGKDTDRQLLVARFHPQRTEIPSVRLFPLRLPLIKAPANRRRQAVILSVCIKYILQFTRVFIVYGQTQIIYRNQFLHFFKELVQEIHRNSDFSFRPPMGRSRENGLIDGKDLLHIITIMKTATDIKHIISHQTPHDQEDKHHQGNPFIIGRLLHLDAILF